MKAKKAAKRLAKVEGLLSNVIEQYAENHSRVRELLDSARESVALAKKTVDVRAAKATGKAQQPKRRRFSAATRKKLSAAAKRRWAQAKRKGVQSAVAKPMTESATA